MSKTPWLLCLDLPIFIDLTSYGLSYTFRQRLLPLPKCCPDCAGQESTAMHKEAELSKASSFHNSCPPRHSFLSHRRKRQCRRQISAYENGLRDDAQISLHGHHSQNPSPPSPGSSSAFLVSVCATRLPLLRHQAIALSPTMLFDCLQKSIKGGPHTSA